MFDKIFTLIMVETDTAVIDSVTFLFRNARVSRDLGSDIFDTWHMDMPA